MKQKIIDTNWEKLIIDELDVNNACSNFTDAFLTIAKECIPTREVTIQTDDKMQFDNRVNNLKKLAKQLFYAYYLQENICTPNFKRG
jgi:azurin